jgi:hypothetical protein
MTFQLKHIKGVPYFVKENRAYTFELENGQPSATCVAIGTYDEASDSVLYDDAWFERVRDRLETFRRRVEVIERDKLRETVDKPQKQRKSVPNKSKRVTAKSTAGK